MFNINKFLPMTGFEPWTSAMEATALPTEPHNHCPLKDLFTIRLVFIESPRII